MVLKACNKIVPSCPGRNALLPHSELPITSVETSCTPTTAYIKYPNSHFRYYVDIFHRRKLYFCVNAVSGQNSGQSFGEESDGRLFVQYTWILLSSKYNLTFPTLSILDFSHPRNDQLPLFLRYYRFRIFPTYYETAFCQNIEHVHCQTEMQQEGTKCSMWSFLQIRMPM